jgi:hypothetical protein
MLKTDNSRPPKSAMKFYCETCDHGCSKQSEISRHNMTAKHIRATNANTPAPPKNTCELCKRCFKHASSFSRHKKTCLSANPSTPSIMKTNVLYNKDEPNLVEALIKESMEFKNVILELVKSNADLQKQMLEVCKNSNSNNSNNSHNNNKTFNMQVFLNEQCKDAMNIMDFVNTFKMDFSDLEKVGEVGYVEGMSNMIIQKLNELDVYKRPIHCSDVKRDVMFIKDKNVWEKENGNHDKLRLAIRYIGKKNTDLLNKWCDAHPGSKDSDNYLNDLYMEMVMQAMGGRGDREENENKIMRKIARTVLIDKTM